MKKISLFLLPALFAVSCSQSEPPTNLNEDSEPTDQTVNYQLRTEAEVISLAQSLVPEGENLSRSEKKVVDKSNVIKISSHKSRNSDEPLMYAVNYENNDGYVLISANRNVTPILGIIDSGTFNEEELKDSEAYQFIKEGAEQIAMVGPNPDLKPIPIEPTDPLPLIMAWKEDTIKSFHCNPPLLEVEWGQRWPENVCTSNNRAGCGPIAAMQIMSYFELPATMKFTYFGDQDYKAIDWKELKKHKTSTNFDLENMGMAVNFHYADCPAAPGNHTFLARIASEVGYRLKSTYYKKDDMYPYFKDGKKYFVTLSSPTTGTDFKDIQSELIKILPGVTQTYTESLSSVYSALYSTNNKSVALVIASDKDFTAEDGLDRHIFVIDATANIYYLVTVKYNYNPADGSYESIEVLNYTDQKYLHCNWGEAGRCNGYYHIGLLDMEHWKDTITEPQYIKSRANYISDVRALIYTK